MNIMRTGITAVASCMLLFTAQAGFAQGLKLPAPSPSQTIKQDFALSSVEVNYSRPAKNGRTIMGDLVPYNKVWRTGANGATTITFGDDVTFGGKPVKAGKYGLLTIPGAKEWTVILTSSLDVTSPAAYKQENDVARVTVKPVSMNAPVESFMISFDEVKPTSMDLLMLWDKTLIPVKITADIDARVTDQITKAMQSEKKPYFQAALYYFESGKDPKQAQEWIDAAAAQQPDAFWVLYQQARIHAKNGDKAGAKAAAQKSIELAKTAKNDDYVALNNKLLATLK